MKRKLNIKGIIVLILFVLSVYQIISDAVKIVNGATYTRFGIATLIICIFIANECECYIKKLIERK